MFHRAFGYFQRLIAFERQRVLYQRAQIPAVTGQLLFVGDFSVERLAEIQIFIRLFRQKSNHRIHAGDLFPREEILAHERKQRPALPIPRPFIAFALKDILNPVERFGQPRKILFCFVLYNGIHYIFYISTSRPSYVTVNPYGAAISQNSSCVVQLLWQIWCR